MDNENSWNWNSGDVRRVSSVYQDEDETNAFILVNPQQDIESQKTESQNIEVQDTTTQTIKPKELFEEAAPQELQPQNPELQNTNDNIEEKITIQSQNTQSQPINTQTGTQQSEMRTEAQTGSPQSDFHPIVLPQHTYQNYNDYNSSNNNTRTQHSNLNQHFSAQDISENKVSAIAAYLLGPIGIIIALLIARDSKYTAFHVRQALKITICSVILELFAAVFALFGMIAFVGIIFKLMLILTCAAWAGTLILRLIAIAQVSNGEAKEPAVICSFAFFK